MDNKEKLGRVLDKRMKRTSSSAVGITAELGIINSNMSLTSDSLGSPIPKGQYMIDIRLGCSTYDTSKTTHSHSGGSHGGHDGGSGTHTHSDGEHTHRLPENFRELKAGDRVLIVWCGNEPVVTNIVTSS